MVQRLKWMSIILVFSAGMATSIAEPIQISGRYPQLAVSNDQGECGIGAVVPWAGRLWFITYSPHRPTGSSDKLYELDAAMNVTIRPESIGGTPAGRLIHRESDQLFIGPYAIDANGGVRAIPYDRMVGRHTAVARHLTDPAGKVYYYDMEGLLYEVDVKTLDVNLLYKRALPGWHAKGGYTGQGRLVLANNGERPSRTVDPFKPFDYQFDPARHDEEDAGALGDWDGRQWRLIRRRQFTEVTSRGGIQGAPDDKAPVWAVGWDKRSLLLNVMEDGRWHTFRLPKADYSYDGDHGWHTEWPRIREVVPARAGKPAKYLMNMHGGWFDVPGEFAASKPVGLRPIGSYIKVTGDFTHWNGRIVFGCDDTAASGFHLNASLDTFNSLNGLSNSGLWFADQDRLHQAGRPAGFGGVWLADSVKAGAPSEPFLLAGYTDRVVHLAHAGAEPVRFRFEIDADGRGQWASAGSVSVAAKGYAFHILPDDVKGEWIRVVADRDVDGATAYFHYGPGGGAVQDPRLFAALADIDDRGAWNAAVQRTEADERILLAAKAHRISASGEASDARHYRVTPEMKFISVSASDDAAELPAQSAVIESMPLGFDQASVIVEEQGQRYRLPRAAQGYDRAWPAGWYRANRELVTERSLLNAGGLFYVLPRENSGGIRRVKPVAAHKKRVVDFCSWRGLTVLSGTRADATPDGHYFAGDDGSFGLWFGDIDDLWKLGKPAGIGGPWHGAAVKAGEPGDPYLMTGFDRKRLELSHGTASPVEFRIEVDFVGTGEFVTYQVVTVRPADRFTHAFPRGFAAHWVRLTPAADADNVTATFIYE